MLLELIDDQNVVSMRGVAEALEWTIPHAGMAILRARRAGLARRCTGGYRLSRRGLAKLDWARAQEEE
jgi:hypothetical protein